MEGLVDTFSNRLNTAMRIRNIKATELSEKTGIAKSSLSEYINGKYEAKQDGVYLLARALNVNEAWLMGLDVPMDRELKTDVLGNLVVSIPLLGSVKAGYNYLAQENWIGTVDVETSLVGNGKDFFALKVKGDSMAPVFVEEDIVIVRKQNDCENNEFAIVIINGDEGTLKKIKKTDNGIILQPLNPAYGPVMYTKEEMETIPVLIAGIVKQLKREF